MKEFKSITPETEEFVKKIVDAAFNVHKNLGPGLLEKVYETCFCHELKKRDLDFKRQIDIPFVYDGLKFDEGLRIDVLVENKVICELKAVDQVNNLWEAQILGYLKLAQISIGLLINFNVPLIKNGIKRYII